MSKRWVINLRSLVAPTISAGIWSIAWSRILSIDTNLLRLLLERQEAVVVLEQDDTLSCNLSGKEMMVLHNVDMFVDFSIWWVP